MTSSRRFNIPIPLQKAASCILTLLLALPATFSFPQSAYAITCGTGSVNVTFYDDGGGQCRGFATTVATTTWIVPTDWSSVNSIVVIGGGGGGAGSASDGSQALGGGGGGEYRIVSNNGTFTPGGNVYVVVGAGGAGGAIGGNVGNKGVNTLVCNSTSNCTGMGGSAVVVWAGGWLGRAEELHFSWCRGRYGRRRRLG